MVQLRVRRVDHAAHLVGEGEERRHVLPGVQPRLRDHREARSPFVVEGLKRGLGGVGVDGGVANGVGSREGATQRLRNSRVRYVGGVDPAGPREEAVCHAWELQ